MTAPAADAGADRRRVLLVVGRSCAGKSTFGRRAQEAHGARFFEVSTELREVQRERGAAGAGALRVHPYALTASRIARRVLAGTDGLVVVSGFRTVEQLDELTALVPRPELVYVHAPVAARYDRCLERSREDAAASRRGFRGLDEDPAYTLLPTARQLARHVIVNLGPLDDYLSAVDAVVRGHGPAINPTGRHRDPRTAMPYRLLAFLLHRGRPCSLEELALGLGRPDAAAVAALLRRYPALTRTRAAGAACPVEPSDTGRAYARCAERLFG